jgi:hypothetical protein
VDSAVALNACIVHKAILERTANAIPIHRAIQVTYTVMTTFVILNAATVEPIALQETVAVMTA